MFVQNRGMETSQLREQIKAHSTAELSRLTGLHRNTIARFVAGHDMLAGNVARLRAALKTINNRKRATT